ncbi:MAG: hypothetical protein IKN81_06735 [Oscillospiraceae bacterium]|nr:hypothetical protein [Oscillospiraceae bacterium]
MKQAKKALSILLTLAMLIGLVPGFSVPAVAEYIPKYEVADSISSMTPDGQKYLPANSQAAVSAEGTTVTVLDATGNETLTISDDKVTMPNKAPAYILGKYDSGEGNHVYTLVPCYTIDVVEGIMPKTISDLFSNLFYTSDDNDAKTLYYKGYAKDGSDALVPTSISLQSEKQFIVTIGSGNPVAATLNDDIYEFTGTVTGNIVATFPPHTHTIGDETITFQPWTDQLAKAQYPGNEDATAANCLPATAGNYYLTGDVELSSEWEIPESTAINLSLNGKTITNAQEFGQSYLIRVENSGSSLSIFEEAAGEGKIRFSNDNAFIVKNGGTLTLNGGSVARSENRFETSVAYVGENGTFIMNGGQLSNTNTGVLVSQGTFTMTGGSISANDIGVYLRSGTFTMNGGSISENQLGVSADASFTVSGNVKISENTAANVSLNADSPALITIGEAGLTGEAEIGVTMFKLEQAGDLSYRRVPAYGVFTGGAKDKSTAANFESDMIGCVITQDGDEFALKQLNYTISATAEEVAATAGTDLSTIVNGDTVKVTVALKLDEGLDKPQGAEFTLSYDKEYFELVAPTETAPNPVLPQGVSNNAATPDDGEGNYQVTLVDSNPNIQKYDDGTALATFTFRVKQGISETAGKECSFTVSDAKVGTEITELNEITAQVESATVTIMPIQRDVKLPANTNGIVLTTDEAGEHPLDENNENAAFDGMDLKLYIKDSDTNNYTYAVKYTVKDEGGNDVAKTATIDPSGFALIPAADVISDITITEVSKLLGGYDEPEIFEDYITGWTLILVKPSANNTTFPVYQYNGKDMYYVDYGKNGVQSFAYIVEGPVTADTVKSKLSLKETLYDSSVESSDQRYSYYLTDLYLDMSEPSRRSDVNGTRAVDYSDLLLAYRSIHKVYTLDETYMKYYLHADVNGDHKIDASDVSFVSGVRAGEIEDGGK